MLPKSRFLLLAGLLALTACGQPTQDSSSAALPRPAAQALGLFELNVTGATSASPTASIRPARGLSAQAVEYSGLDYGTAISTGTVTDEVNRVRYLQASFRVRNTGSTTLTLPTFVPVDTAGGAASTVGTTPFKDVRRFDGTALPEARVNQMTVDQARKPSFSGGAVTFAPDNAATPLVTSLNTGDLQVTLPSGLQLAGVAHQGWQSSSSLAPGGEQVITFAARIPMASSPTDDPFAFSLVFAATDNPGTLALTNIGTVQGSGTATTLPTTTPVTVEGVVTANLVAGTLKVFALQEEGIDADGTPSTSDGVFIFCGSTGGNCPTVSVGDRVRVTGTPSEFVTVTQISPATISAVTVLGSGAALPDAQTLTLPLAVAEREKFEGMRVSTSGVVTNNFTLGRGASFDIADARIPNFTQVNAPSVSNYATYQQETANRFIRIDDGTRAQNPDPVLFARGGQPLSAVNTLRGGDSVTVTGVLSYSNDGWSGSGSLDTYRIHATAANATITASNPRPAQPDSVGGSLRVGSMNVLNFFTTINGTNAGCTAGGSGSTSTTTGQAPRGANSCDEFLRQRIKTVETIRTLSPDVLGLLEIQNDYVRGATSSIANLVDALNDPATGGTAGTYAYINPGANIGTDAITVAMIYKPAAVSPVGTLAVLDNSFDPNYGDTCNRPSLAQTFQSTANGGRLTAVMAHLKSKGSACATGTGNADINDGQGSSNGSRLAAANVLTAWLATNPTGVTESDHILMGDLNAYRMEDPIQRLLRGADNTAGTADDMVNRFGAESYSYQFDGAWGSLDHAIVSQSLNSQVTGQTKWHINADEPIVLDYNTEFKTAGQVSSFYAPDVFRNSDHDPVLVGLNLNADAPLPVASVTLTPGSASVNAPVGGNSVTQSYTATGVNTSGPISVTVTPVGGAPAIVSVPATTTSGAAFNATVTAPNGTTPGTYTYTITASNGALSQSSTLTVTVVQPSLTLSPATASMTVSAGGVNMARNLTATGVNTSGPITLSVTPVGGAPAIVSVPATATSGTAFAAVATAPAGTTPGTYTYTITASNGALSQSSTLTVTVAPALTSKIIISEFRFRGPGGGNDEFIELHNPGTSAITVNGWTVQGLSGSGTSAADFSNRVTLGNISIPAGGFYLLTNSASTGGYSLTATATGNATYGTGIGDNRAIQLVNASGVVQDRVGFAAAGVCESTCIGDGPTTAVTPQISWARNVVGGQIVDTDNNAADFTYRSTGGANPQNASMTFTGIN